jgi:hypothetical protein
MQKQKQQIAVELDEKASEGIYSNFVLTSHTASEFILDFARMLPGIKKAKVFARIILTPQSAKTLHMVLGNALGKYESTFGEIKLPAAPKDRLPDQSIGFQSIDTTDPEEEKKKKTN